MGSATSIDQTENEICDLKPANLALSRLPKDHPQLKHWKIWATQVFSDMPWQQPLTECMTIGYARMLMRNGQLSPSPRSYHNELHINDLLLRIMYCAEKYSHQLTANGLAILSFFAVCHDLRQAEPQKAARDHSLVGANEQASFEEALRIIDSLGETQLWNQHHRLLLKTMIEGSTFGSGGVRSKNFFQGNLAKHLLEQLRLPNKNDEQLVLLGCDIDTANVSLPLSEFAASAVLIFDELVSHHQASISAHQFFSQQQIIYFFEQQVFNANITQDLFESHKQANSEMVLELSKHISRLPQDLTAEDIKEEFISKAQQLENA